MFIQDKVADINKRLTILRGLKKIVIWGAGVHTRELLERTEILDYDIFIICDNDEEKKGNRFFLHYIMKPEEIEWEAIKGVVISVPNFEKEITEILWGKYFYQGEIVKLYCKEETTPFYKLYDKNREQVRYLGDYENWEQVSTECKGYDDDTIISKVAESVNKVLLGKAEYERDSVLFHDQKYLHQIISVIQKSALQNNDGVRILDIGGSLGSTYLQNRKYLKDIKGLEWIIAEQDKMAQYGHDYLENETMKFICSSKEYSEVGKIDIVLMSGSLQYICEYQEVIRKILAAKPMYIILDRVLISDRLRMCKEEVPQTIYSSSYPVIIFEERELLSYFSESYTLIDKSASSVPEEAYFPDGKATSLYYVLEKN